MLMMTPVLIDDDCSVLIDDNWGCDDLVACSFANNQHKVDLGDSLADSPFEKVLRCCGSTLPLIRVCRLSRHPPVREWSWFSIREQSH